MSDLTRPSDGAGLAAEGAPELISLPQPPPPSPAPADQDAAQGPPAPADQAPAASAPVAEDQAPVQAADLPSGKAVVARYGVLRSLGLFQHDLEGPLRAGTNVVVRSDCGFL